MKNVILALMTILAFSFSSVASAPKDLAKQKSDVKTHTPPHYHFRVGTYHRNIPRHAARVVRNGNVYYNHNGVFFTPRGRGWVVVRPPMHRPRYNRNTPRYNNRRSCQPGPNRNGNRNDGRMDNQNGNRNDNRNGNGGRRR